MSNWYADNFRWKITTQIATGIDGLSIAESFDQ